MKNIKSKKWEVIHKINKGEKLTQDKIIEILLNNRGITTKGQKERFLEPEIPAQLTLRDFKLTKSALDKTIKRIQSAIKKNERIVVYGDYDADGICATAILWEALYELSPKTLPHIPDRFVEGYGINAESVSTLKKKYPDLKLIVTVDNGIVANDAVGVANKLGIDVIISDHHQKEKEHPKSFATVHTTEIGGAGIAWVIVRELAKKYKNLNPRSLELATIGTIADQIPLVGPNRSLVKYGLEELNNTDRIGLLALFNSAGVTRGSINTYHIGFIIAPRLNAMGRLKHAIESLRLLCTKDVRRAENLARKLGKTNLERQKIVEEVVMHAQDVAKGHEWKGAVVLSHESYHEGVIGLAASKLVETFYRPAIVISQGKNISKASARSISGFNLIGAIRELNDIIEGGGGHAMAAGFSIKTKRISEFVEKFDQVAMPLLTEEILKRTQKVDLNIPFKLITKDLIHKISKFEPTGSANPTPTFITKSVEVVDARLVGSDKKHLKLALLKNGIVIEAIAFGFGEMYSKLGKKSEVDIVYALEINEWNGEENIQLKIRDIKHD